MRYISEIEFRKQMAQLLKDLNTTKIEKEKRRIADEIEYLKRMRAESSETEKMQTMNNNSGKRWY